MANKKSNKKYPPRHTVGLALDRELHNKLKAAAKAERPKVSVSFIIRRAVILYFNSLPKNANK